MIPGRSVNAHHLIPKSKKGKDADPCHVVCHDAIHANYTEAELAAVYNTWEKLRAAPKLQAFLKWIRSKPAEFRSHTKQSKSKRGKWK